jgi:hypothetical protein
LCLLGLTRSAQDYLKTKTDTFFAQWSGVRSSYRKSSVLLALPVTPTPAADAQPPSQSQSQALTPAVRRAQRSSPTNRSQQRGPRTEAELIGANRLVAESYSRLGGNESRSLPWSVNCDSVPPSGVAVLFVAWYLVERLVSCKTFDPDIQSTEVSSLPAWHC